MSIWQPMDTAPKDGTHVLLRIIGREYEPSVIEGWWDYDSWDVVRLDSHGCGCCGGRDGYLPLEIRR